MISNLFLARVASFALTTAATAQTVTAPSATPGAATAPDASATPGAATAPAGPGAATAPATPGAATTTTTTAASTVDIGVQPLADVPAPNYVAWAWQSNAFEIASAKVALRKATRADVKAYAQTMLTAHETMQQALEASLKNDTRVFTKPADALDPADAALVAQLEKAPAPAFDTLYLTQQAAAHQKAWAMQKGFANSGQDAALKTLATTNVPMIEQHYTQAKSLTPAGQAG